MARTREHTVRHEVADTETRPRVSVVVPMRNPAYGEGLVHRAQIFFDILIAFARRYGLSCEIVIVEWNPVADAPRFRELLSWPGSLGPVTVRFIEVPAAVHDRLPNAQHIPFMNTRARNVGVRRARGTYILVTGADVVPSGGLIRFITNTVLSERTFYRIDRRDLSHRLPARWSPRWQLAYCRCQDVTVHTYYGSIRECRRWHPSARRAIKARHQAVLEEYRRHLDSPIYAGPTDAFGQDRLIIPADGLHRNGAGEFFLMHRDRWHELRGYTELSSRGHGDSLLCWTAASAGLDQVILGPPAYLFHQPHSRSAASQWPATDWRPWYARYLECRRTVTALITNAEDWGLRDAGLPEYTCDGRSCSSLDTAT